MFYQPLRYDDKIISKYCFFNKIPVIESFFHIPKSFLEKQLGQIFFQLPKNITIYIKGFNEKFKCNFFLAKAAFPNYFENNIETLLSTRTDQRFRNKLINEYPSLNNIAHLIKKKEELSFEKLSFEDSTQENFFLFQHPNADRSEKRKNMVIHELNKVSIEIQRINEKLNFSILYVPAINLLNVDIIRRFLCNPIKIQVEVPPPVPINSNFYENLFNQNFCININDGINNGNVFVSPIMGSFFSSVIASQTNNFLKIKVSNAIEIKNILINLFNSNTKIRLKYSQYQLLQEITKKFDSIYLKKCIECFKSNINDLNDAFEQCDTFIELQEKIFDLNEENFQETYLFIQDQIQNSDLKPDVAFQIELASALRPKYNKLFNQLYVNIKTYIDPKFPCEIYQFDLSETEMILINDDSSALLELLSKNPNFDLNQNINCHCSFCKNASLIAASCFYGAASCFKFLQSNGAKIEVEYLMEFAIAGGNIEIIHLLDIQKEEIIIGVCSTAARFHRNTILEWLIEQEIDDSPFLESASIHSNFKAARIYFDLKFKSFIDNNSNFSNQNQRISLIDNEINESLQKSLKHNCLTYFRFLLNFPGANIDHNLLIPAIQSGSIQILDLIISFGDNIFKNSYQNISEEIILTAIRTGQIAFIDKLFKLKELRLIVERRILSRDEFAQEILRTRNKQIIQKFISFGNIFHYPFSIESIISRLVEENDIELIEKIVDKNYFQCRKDWSPFPSAKSFEMVRYLLDCKSDFNFCNVEGDTCLSNAIKNNDKKIIQLLITNGANIRTSDFERANQEIKDILLLFYNKDKMN